MSNVRAKYLLLALLPLLGWTAETTLELTAYAAALRGGAAAGQNAAPAERDGTKVWHLAWDAGKAKFAEFHFAVPPELPDFQTARIAVRVYVPAGGGARRLALRLLDRDGEVLQFHATDAALQAGAWNTVSYQVTPDNAAGSWGPKPNKVLDPPARLLGFGIDFAPGSGPGELWLGDFALEPGPDLRREALPTVQRFDRNELWRVSFRGGPGETRQEDDGLLLSTAQAPRCDLRGGSWELLPPAVAPVAVRVQAHLQSGAASLRAVFRGSDGKAASTATRELAAGANDCRLELSPEVKALRRPVRLDTLVVESAPKAFSAKFLSVGVVQLLRVEEAVRLELVTGQPLNLLLPGQESTLALRWRNTSTAPAAFSAKVRFEDGTGRGREVSGDFALAPGEARLWQPGWQPERLGIWYLRATLSGHGENAGRANLDDALAYMQPTGPTPGRAPGFLFGICAHTNRWAEGTQDREAQAAALCGAKIVRADAPWFELEPSRGEWRWAQADRLLELYGRQGLELQYLLGFPPRWAVPPDVRRSPNWSDWVSAAPELEPWREAVRAITARYCDRIRYWEVWNEPDLNGFAKFSAEAYVQLLQAAFAELRQTCPQAKLLTGGFATLTPHRGRRDPDFQAKVLRQALGSYDVHAYHEHGSFAAYAAIVDGQFLPLRQATGAAAVPWYANETAIDSIGIGELAQAETLFKKLLFAWSRGAIGYNWYDLRNDGCDPRNAEHNFGLLTFDFRPKAAYPVYNTLATLYTRLAFDRQLELPGGLYALAFKGPGEHALACWREPTAPQQTLLLRTDAASAASVDPMGNATPLPLVDGLLSVDFGATPVTLRLRGATTVAQAAPLLSLDGQTGIAPGRTSRLVLRLHNPLARPAVLKLSAEVPPGVALNAVGLDPCELPAQGQQVLTASLTGAPDLKIRYGQTLRLNLRYSLEGTPWAGSLAIPLRLGIAIPAGSFERAPDFVLDAREQQVSLFANDPHNLDKLWSGPEDLSGRVWLSLDGDRLRLKVAVRDDVQHQPHHGSDVWQGDGVQFALQAPGSAGYWELGLSLLANGQPAVFAWSAPAGLSAEAAVAAIVLEAGRQGTETVYQASLPLAALGLNPETLRRGLRFNLLVNDSDGAGREGWLHVAPNLGSDKDPSQYPVLTFE